MRKTKAIDRVAVSALLAVLVVMFSCMAWAGEVPDGFAGVPWGASRDQIIQTMKEQGYRQLKGDYGSKLVFKGEFAGASCYLSFYSIANSFYSGTASECAKGPHRPGPQSTFDRIVSMLSEKYGPPQKHWIWDPKTKEDRANEKELEAGGAMLEYAIADWDMVDSGTSDKYSINVYLSRCWYAEGRDGKLDYSVIVIYSADSLKKRLEQKIL